MGHVELRVEFDGLLVAGNGLVHLALVFQRNAKTEVGQGEFRGEFGGLFEAGDGLVQLTLLQQCKPQVVVGWRAELSGRVRWPSC